MKREEITLLLLLRAAIETKTAEKFICFLLGSGDHILEDVAVKERELFISDATDVYPASALRWLVTEETILYAKALLNQMDWLKIVLWTAYWWSRWLILPSFTQASDMWPSKVAIKKICLMVVIFTCCQLFLTALSTSIWLPLAMYYDYQFGQQENASFQKKILNIWDLQWI